MADISLTASVDASQFDAGLDKMKNAAAIKSQAMVSELDKIAAAEARITREANKAATAGGPTGSVRGGYMGGRNTAYMGGQLAMQAQDVAVMAQMGMSATRIIAQQGSQILSILGPHGAVAGGVLAIGAAILSFASNTEDATVKAKELADQIAAAKQHSMDLRDIQNDIDLRKIKGPTFEFIGGEPALGEFGGGFAPRKGPQMLMITAEERRERLKLEQDYQKELESIHNKPGTTWEQQNELTKKATERNIMLEKEWRDKVMERNKEMMKGIEEREKKEAKTENERIMDDILEQEMAEIHLSDRQAEQGAKIAKFWEALQLEDILRAEADEAERKAAAEERAANARATILKLGDDAYFKLRESTYGKSSLDKQRERNAARRAEREEAKWEKRMDKTGGLTRIKRDLGGKIISGTDPVSGEPISAEEAQERWRDAKRFHGAAERMRAIIDEESMRELVDAIAELLPK